MRPIELAEWPRAPVGRHGRLGFQRRHDDGLDVIIADAARRSAARSIGQPSHAHVDEAPPPATYRRLAKTDCLGYRLVVLTTGTQQHGLRSLGEGLRRRWATDETLQVGLLIVG